MKVTLSKLFTLAVGAAIGSAVTYKYLKTKYDDILREELESMREYYSEKYGEPCDDGDEEEEQVVETQPTESDVMNDIRRSYAAIAKNNGYINSEEAKQIDDVDKPYVIDADDYGEYEDYSLNNLTYFADKILADDTGEIIEDVDDTVGPNLWDKFPDDDTVFIRNDKLMSDYEIQRDYRSYDEVFYDSPHQAEAE